MSASRPWRIKGWLFGWLTPIDRKLVRDFRHSLGPVLAISLVIAAGLATMVMASGTQVSLEDTRAAYYERNRFADVFAHVRRAPLAVADRIGEIDGVARVEARIVQDVLLDMPAMREPVRGRVLSWPERGEPRVNAPIIEAGRSPAVGRPDEVMVNAAFADAHGLGLGDSVSVNMMGVRRDLEVVGIALSPEFIYVVAPGSFVPDDAGFGVFWMGRAAAEATTDLSGAFNDLVVQIRRDASIDAMIERIDLILAPYGGTGAYGRDEQASHAFLDGEMNELGVLATSVPPIFLVVAAFLLNLVVGRLIDTEREQIGLLKAFGYTDAAIGWHYTKFVLLICLIGVVAGIAGGAWFGRLITRVYTEFFQFPFLNYRLNLELVAVAVFASLAAALGGAALAVRRAVRIAPAVAMRPPAPISYRRTLLDRIGVTWLMGAGGRMVLRNVLRRPLRSGLTSLGIAFSVALLVSTLFMLSSLDRMLEVFFHDTQRQDLTVTFVEERGEAVRADLLHLPGVIAVDLSRAVPVRLISGPRSERISLIGRDPDARLSLVLNEDEEEIALPPAGLALSAVVAEDLGVGVGDSLRVEVLTGRRPSLDIPVTLVMRDYVGTSAYMTRAALDRALGEAPSANMADLAVDPLQLDALYASLTESPAVLGVSRREAGLERLRALLDESLVVSIIVYIGFASVIAVGVVYNSARISLAERGRELASMRVLGYHRREVALILVGELALLVFIALPVGSVLGYFVALGLVQQFGTDLFRLPFVITPPTYAWACLVVIAASVAAALLVVHRVRRLDLIAVLKTRE